MPLPETQDVNPVSEKLASQDIEAGPGSHEEEAKAGDDDDDEDEDILGLKYAIFWLGCMTILIAFLSDALAATIQEAANSCNVSGVFVAAIILPIVGNACEHAGAVMFAMKNNLDLSLGVAIGSSTQIGLMVLPLLVLLGAIMGKDLSMNFGSYEAFTLFTTIIIVAFAIQDGTSNWLVGAVLIAAYCLIASGFLAQDDVPL
jgi:Ca2+:H+ antiporter